MTIALRTADRSCAEWAAAEAYESGAVGLEERSDAGNITLVLYAPEAATEAILVALARLPVEVGAAEPLPDVDWAERWKADHVPVPISPRLLIRPPFGAAPTLEGGRRALVIAPGAAFGTGSHESTRLALEWVDALAARLPTGGCVLDVGAGTGVLGLAALALARVRAVALDLDPLATAAARDNARRNQLEDRLRVFTGGIEALSPVSRFDLVVANLLRRELEPILPAFVRLAKRGSPIVLSGLLEREREGVEALAAACGLTAIDARSRRDASGETWIALLMRHANAGASLR